MATYILICALSICILYFKEKFLILINIKIIITWPAKLVVHGHTEQGFVVFFFNLPEVAKQHESLKTQVENRLYRSFSVFSGKVAVSI